MYFLEVTTDFAASHIIEGHAGKCARLHGHNWKVWVSVACPELDALGIGIDFAALKIILNQIVDPLDHRHLNDLPPFQTINPTAENLARFIFEAMAKALPQGAQMDEVKLSETDRCSVRYRAD